MQKSLGDLLAEMPERETGGSIAAARFAYQRDWALCRMLRLHQKGNEYALVFEFHEDVTELNAPDSPTKATFYQVKTDEKKTWTLNRLTARLKGKNGELASIMGRLCAKAESLPKGSAEFRFVSNAQFSVELQPPHTHKDGELDLKLLTPDALAKLKDALDKELGPFASEVVEESLKFEVADLPLLEHSSSATGKLADFMDAYAKGCTVAITPLYRTLAAEIFRRTVAPRPHGSLEAICKKKAIARADFDAMLTQAIKSTPTHQTWSLISAQLTADGVLLADSIALQRDYRDLYIWLLQPDRLGLVTIKKKLYEAAKAALSKPGAKLLDVATDAVAMINPTDLEDVGLTIPAGRMLVMVDLYERQNAEVQDAGDQPSEKDA
jgi:hypothetical protein